MGQEQARLRLPRYSGHIIPYGGQRFPLLRQMQEGICKLICGVADKCNIPTKDLTKDKADQSIHLMQGVSWERGIESE